METLPDLKLGQLVQLLLHVLLQLSWPQDGLADRTHGSLGVVQTLHFTWETGERS